LSTRNSHCNSNPALVTASDTYGSLGAGQKRAGDAGQNATGLRPLHIPCSAALVCSSRSRPRSGPSASQRFRLSWPGVADGVADGPADRFV
jgi:hypothetical protein